MNSIKNGITSTIYTILLAALMLSVVAAGVALAPVVIAIFAISDGVKVFNHKQQGN